MIRQYDQASVVPKIFPVWVLMIIKIFGIEADYFQTSGICIDPNTIVR